MRDFQNRVQVAEKARQQQHQIMTVQQAETMQQRLLANNDSEESDKEEIKKSIALLRNMGASKLPKQSKIGQPIDPKEVLNKLIPVLQKYEDETLEFANVDQRIFPVIENATSGHKERMDKLAATTEAWKRDGNKENEDNESKQKAKEKKSKHRSKKNKATK